MAEEAPNKSEEAQAAQQESVQPEPSQQPAEAPTEEAKADEGAKKKAKEPERQDMTTLNERTIAAMSYFGFLAIVPFYLKKDSEFCRFHGKQGMLLAIIFFLAKLFTVIDFIFDLMLILQVFFLFSMGFAALSGRWKRIPLFYDWSCQLEEALVLTPKNEADQVPLKPQETGETVQAEEPAEEPEGKPNTK